MPGTSASKLFKMWWGPLEAFNLEIFIQSLKIKICETAQFVKVIKQEHIKRNKKKVTMDTDEESINFYARSVFKYQEDAKMNFKTSIWPFSRNRKVNPTPVWRYSLR